ncbi:hypothetical protein [Solitalea canadensis]|uniref:Uncharacterized protein n=1 Tax=Solitalea canadensis (strain ATCC 29591 / DSM 3403 / JCM 21819 / LMG 8368 / NBRC 15130 / NCIMB 12057 / USAM 9D) TaxID=929556 RepID=H8KTW2_SOLCM|nr:hypothetical protein [Solitalea canadensis]AFD06812.1 hypothetical protein Solca_1746 [Solitalea canadensis DSM 3403]
MKKYLLLLVIVITPYLAISQSKEKNPIPRAPTRESWKEEQKKHECITRAVYSESERTSFYPFNKASNILFVSFINQDDSIIQDELPMERGKVALNKLKEIVYLNDEQKNALTNVLYNIGYKGKPTINTGAACYNPHNAILFMNDKKQVFEYIELCFDCSRHELSSKKINTGDFCTQKYDLLKQLFQKVGIKLTELEFD